jgi:hypothetical protein
VTATLPVERACILRNSTVSPISCTALPKSSAFIIAPASSAFFATLP